MIPNAHFIIFFDIVILFLTALQQKSPSDSFFPPE